MTENSRCGEAFRERPEAERTQQTALNTLPSSRPNKNLSRVRRVCPIQLNEELRLEHEVVPR